MPAYLCFLGGVSLEQLSGAEPPAKGDGLTARILAAALAFVAGFATVFVALGASASAINQLLMQHMAVIAPMAGIVIVAFGLHYMGLIRIPFLNYEARVHVEHRPAGLVGAYVIGLAFAFGWTPCVGPVLATILTVAASRESLVFGASLLAVYALGLGVPFLVAAFAARPFIRFMRRFRRHLRKVEIGIGAALVAVGIAFVTGAFQSMSYLLIEWFPALAAIG